MLDRVQSRPYFLLGLLCIALLITFHRLIPGETFFWGLPGLQFVPWREYAFDLIRSGVLPLWNPYNGAGSPLLANYQSALLYPLNWPGFVLPLAWSMSLTAVLHLFIAGWGMWIFTGRLGITDLGRGVSAMAFGMTSYLVARLGTYPTILTAAWIPWILWAALRVLTRFSRRDTAWLGLFVGLQLLAGHAQTAWYSLLLTLIFSFWWSLTHPPSHWLRLIVVLLTLGLGVGIAALQLLPTAELLAQSQRSGGADYEFVVNYSYAPARIFNLVSPNFFGNPGDGSYLTKGKGAFFEDAVYIGLLPLIAALAAASSWVWGKVSRSERPAYFKSVPFWIAIVVFAFVIAFGNHSPVFPFLYDHVPTFNMFQAPVRWHIWTVFGLSMLAGMGVGIWSRGYWVLFLTRLAVAGALGAVALAIIAPNFLPPEVTEREEIRVITRAIIETGIWGALAGILTLTQPELGANRRKWWSLAVLAVVAVDLIYASWLLNPTVPASFYDQRVVSQSSVSRAYWPEDTEEKIKFDQYLLFHDYHVAVEQQTAYRASELSNLNLLDRIALLNNFDPLLVGSFKRYIALVEANPQQRDTLLRAAGVQAVYDPAGKPVKLNEQGSRAWFVESACWHADEDTLTVALLNPAWNPSTQVHLIGEGDCDPTPTEVSYLIPNVSLVSDTANLLEVKVNSDKPGWLILADTYYPGWQAVDNLGQTYPIQRANLAFRAVEVAAGEHSIRFGYQPRWLLPGALATLVSLIILAVLFRSRTA